MQCNNATPKFNFWCILIEVPGTITHHALVRNCRSCMKVGFVGMRCDCNTGGTPRYIVLLNGQQLNCNDETTQEPPEPLKICAFYHLVSPPSWYYSGTACYMRQNGYTIERGFVQGWEKNFADPTIPWTLPISETDKFVDHHEEWITIQLTMETVFFQTEQQIMLEYLIGSLWGLNWKNVC